MLNDSKTNNIARSNVDMYLDSRVLNDYWKQKRTFSSRKLFHSSTENSCWMETISEVMETLIIPTY